MMETDIASEELVKQFLLPQSILPHGEGDVFGACPAPDSVESLSHSLHHSSGSLEGIHETLKLESPDSCCPETCDTDILSIATTQVGLESPVGLPDTLVSQHTVDQCVTSAEINMNPSIFILNNQIPTVAWPGTSLLTSQRGLYLVVDKNGQQTLSLPIAATTTQLDTGQNTSSLLITQCNSSALPSVMPAAESADVTDVKYEEDDQDEPVQPFDYKIFLNKLPPKIEIPSSQQPTNNPSIVFQVMGDETVENVNVNQVITESEDTGTANDIVGDTIKSSSPECQIYKCDLCTATFNRKGNFTRHRLVHTVNSKESFRYKCNMCSRQFLQKCDLTRHMHIHNKTEPHRCTVCDKGYIRMKDLLVHMKFHNREKNCRCPHCDKNFYQDSDLKRHIRCVHEKSKGLTCGHCHKRYVKESTLIRHMQTIHRDIILQSLEQIAGRKNHVEQVESESTSDSSPIAKDTDGAVAETTGL